MATYRIKRSPNLGDEYYNRLDNLQEKRLKKLLSFLGVNLEELPLFDQKVISAMREYDKRKNRF